MRDKDKFRGCLFGGAARDALGYAVEFMSEESIFRKYSSTGIRNYVLSDGAALISDDTQMTLFTAEGLLECRDGDYAKSINAAYLNWLETQRQIYPLRILHAPSWLMHIERLYARRAPGNACLFALRSGGNGSLEKPINDSKGCGGVMRVAPIGLYFSDTDRDVRDICLLGAKAAALTHGHPLGWMPAAALVQIIHEISQNSKSVLNAALSSISTLKDMWPDTEQRQYLISLMELALELALGRNNDLTAIHRLGEGWVADEALAIALYCAVKYPLDIDRALIAAVNHKGDSDSTGAITGNIVGAHIGFNAIPSKYIKNLELCDTIVQLADALCDNTALSGT